MLAATGIAMRADATIIITTKNEGIEMLRKNEFENIFWQQYLLIEEELYEVKRFTAFNVKNYKTYSAKFQKLILETGSEVDNVFREITQLTGDRLKISDYVGPVLAKYPGIISQKVYVKNTDIVITPFDGWNDTQPSQSLKFWEVYNNIKHNRILNEEAANFENALNSIAALFIVEMYYMKTLYDLHSDCVQSFPEDESRIFVLETFPHHVREALIDKMTEGLVVLE